jgi:hypothetical protein
MLYRLRNRKTAVIQSPASGICRSSPAVASALEALEEMSAEIQTTAPRPGQR